MSDLRSFIALHARVYEFLEQQDESTLRAIMSGEVQLAVLRPGDAQASAGSVPRAAPLTPVDLTQVPYRDPVRAAQDLPKLRSEAERRHYIDTAKLRVQELKKVAKLFGLGNVNLKRLELEDLVVRHGLSQGEAEGPASEPPTPAPPPTGNEGSTAEQQAIPQTAQPPSAAPEPVAPRRVEPTSETVKPDADAVAIASRLREIETEQEGATYLRAQHLDREGMLAVAAELQLTRVNRLSQAELEKRVLKQAIGARRKFAGLRKW